MSPTSSRRFRFSLQALFVAITVAGLGAWWTGKYFAVRRAEAAFQRTQAEHEAETVTTDQLCQASRDLLHAELGVPLADHRAARERHAERITLIWRKLEALQMVGLPGGSTDRDTTQIEQLRSEAQRIVDESR